MTALSQICLLTRVLKGDAVIIFGFYVQMKELWSVSLASIAGLISVSLI